MAAGGHFGWDNNVILELVRDIWTSNACDVAAADHAAAALLTKT